jgi:hypothetical protein
LHGDGCSAEKCACSLCSPITSRFTVNRTARKNCGHAAN